MKNTESPAPDAEAVISEADAVLSKKRKRKKRTIRAVLYIIISLVLAAAMYLTDLNTYHPAAFDPAGDAGVYSAVNVECIQPITEANGWTYVFFVNQTEDKLGILKLTATDYEMLSSSVDTYAGADAQYSSSVEVRGLTESFDDAFMNACITSGIADSESDTQFSSIYGLVCLCVNVRHVTLFYLIYMAALYILLPLSVLWLLLCILLHGMKKRRATRAAHAPAQARETENELDDDF